MEIIYILIILWIIGPLTCIYLKVLHIAAATRCVAYHLIMTSGMNLGFIVNFRQHLNESRVFVANQSATRTAVCDVRASLRVVVIICVSPFLNKSLLQLNWLRIVLNCM